ncbi:hypothetical protein GCM10009094_37210 [Massilia aurea]
MAASSVKGCMLVEMGAAWTAGGRPMEASALAKANAASGGVKRCFMMVLRTGECPAKAIGRPRVAGRRWRFAALDAQQAVGWRNQVGHVRDVAPCFAAQVRRPLGQGQIGL